MPQSWPFVTVLVPCRNERAFIADCLDSIVNNGYPSDRLLVLVVDGMSDDGTRCVLEAYVRDHEYIRVIDNQGKTTPKALNLGLREAQGQLEVVARCFSAISSDISPLTENVWFWFFCGTLVAFRLSVKRKELNDG